MQIGGKVVEPEVIGDGDHVSVHPGSQVYKCRHNLVAEVHDSPSGVVIVAAVVVETWSDEVDADRNHDNPYRLFHDRDLARLALFAECCRCSCPASVLGLSGAGLPPPLSQRQSVEAIS